MKLVLKYSFFAFLATLTNIGTQYASLSLYDGTFSLYVAMALGTLTGLVVKYTLDKRYIFYFEVRSKVENVSKFILYSFMGIFTTLIFWGTELLFHFSFSGPWAKYAGAITGLTIGYGTKYHLDRRYVFR